MAEYKCKKCGGDLKNANEGGVTVVKCENCGSVITLSKFLSQDKIKNLYNLANGYFYNGDYEEAKKLYKRITEENGTDAEAYWHLVLCEYQVKYVGERQRTLTINSNPKKPVTDCLYYKSAINNATVDQKSIYEKEAQEILRIQKRINEIAEEEKPFDVFISYKDKDKLGEKTPDSEYAKSIYNDLKDEGYQVFYSAETLKNKIGMEYGPYIYFALSSAKVMIVVGTDKEYFNSGWVKNEWCSFYDKQDENKWIIPVCKNTIDIPNKLNAYQAIEIGYGNWFKNVVNAVKKKIPKIKQNSEKNEENSNLINDIQIYLDQENWGKAKALCETLLKRNKKDAKVYVLKLLAELRLKNEAQLGAYEGDLNQFESYNAAVEYADKGTRDRLLEYDVQAEKNLEYNKRIEEFERLRSVEEMRKRREEQERLRFEEEELLRKRVEARRIEEERKKREDEERLRIEREKKRLYEERKRREEQERLRLEEEKRLKIERERKQEYLKQRELAQQKQICPKCGAYLYKQVGFDSSLSEYICKGCKTMLYREFTTGNYVLKKTENQVKNGGSSRESEDGGGKGWVIWLILGIIATIILINIR